MFADNLLQGAGSMEILHEGFPRGLNNLDIDKSQKIFDKMHHLLL